MGVLPAFLKGASMDRTGMASGVTSSLPKIVELFQQAELSKPLLLRLSFAAVKYLLTNKGKHKKRGRLLDVTYWMGIMVYALNMKLELGETMALLLRHCALSYLYELTFGGKIFEGLIKCSTIGGILIILYLQYFQGKTAKDLLDWLKQQLSPLILKVVFLLV